MLYKITQLTKKISFTLLFCCFFCIVTANNLYAATYTIGVEDLDYLPYYGIKNKNYIGYSRDLFEQFAKDNKHTIIYKVLPVARLFHALVNNDIDAKFPDNPKWRSQDKKKHDISYTQAIIPYTDGIMVKPSRLTSPEESFKRIGTIRGFTAWVLLGDIEQGKVKISENNSISSLIKQTLLGRLDGSFINVAIAEYFLKHSTHGKDAVVFNPKLKNTQDYYYLSSKKTPQLTLEFDQWFKNNSAFNKKLLERWGL